MSAADGLVAIVDDDQAVRDGLEALLESWGYETVAFPDAETLLKNGLAAETTCLLLDVRLPGMDGLKLVAELRRRGVCTPILMMSAHGDVSTAVEAMRRGAQDFIEKPFDDIELMRRLDAIMHCGPQVMMGVPMSAPPAELAATDAVDEINEPAANPFCDLTPRELDVMLEMVRGDPNKVIAHRLGV
ncbi:MAG: response regulator, partial [Pseudomonadota bacterium]